MVSKSLALKTIPKNKSHEILKFLISFIAAYGITMLISGNGEGETGIYDSKINMVDLNGQLYHIHHWIISLIIIVIIVANRKWNAIIIGGLFGVTVQGLAYTDSFVFIP